MPVEPSCLLVALGKLSAVLILPILAGLSIDKFLLITNAFFGIGTTIGIVIALLWMYFTLEGISVGLKKKFDEHPELAG